MADLDKSSYTGAAEDLNGSSQENRSAGIVNGKMSAPNS